MPQSNSPFAVVTGVSGRIGFALAERCAGHGFDMIVADAAPEVIEAAERLRAHGVTVEAVRAELDSADGVEELCDIADVLGRPIDALVTGAGFAPGPRFLDQDVEAVADTLDLGVGAPLRLAHRIGRDMRGRREGRILIAGSPAAEPPAEAAASCGANAFLAGFSIALRDELKDSGVSVTYLAPRPRRSGAAEACARMMAAQDARRGFEAMMRGELGLTAEGAATIAYAVGCAREAPPAFADPEARSFK
ncbi:MAG: SDR family NAD(P)-dependent oxidoreductase [Proteobacteria bacterium]|nr:SDR family NAD(P)-dependent oxidoreductase [Pseudomonadota bacterium]